LASTVANKVIAFAANVLVVRILSKTDYNILGFAACRAALEST